MKVQIFTHSRISFDFVHLGQFGLIERVLFGASQSSLHSYELGRKELHEAAGNPVHQAGHFWQFLLASHSHEPAGLWASSFVQALLYL